VGNFLHLDQRARDGQGEQWFHDETASELAMKCMIFQLLFLLASCWQVYGCSSYDCSRYFASRYCSCPELGDLVFEPSDPALLAGLSYPRGDGRIGMTKTWFRGESPRGVDYSAFLNLHYQIASMKLEQDCTDALQRHKFAQEYVPRTCNDFLIAFDASLPLLPNTHAMQITEPQPPGDPDDVISITLERSDPSWWDYVGLAGIDIPALGMVGGNLDFGSYYAKTATFRLERVNGNLWRSSVVMELAPSSSMEDLLKKYNLWAESIRFSASCECDVGSYHTECVGE